MIVVQVSTETTWGSDNITQHCRGSLKQCHPVFSDVYPVDDYYSATVERYLISLQRFNMILCIWFFLKCVSSTVDILMNYYDYDIWNTLNIFRLLVDSLNKLPFGLKWWNNPPKTCEPDPKFQRCKTILSKLQASCNVIVMAENLHKKQNVNTEYRVKITNAWNQPLQNMLSFCGKNYTGVLSCLVLYPGKPKNSRALPSSSSISQAWKANIIRNLCWNPEFKTLWHTQPILKSFGFSKNLGTSNFI